MSASLSHPQATLTRDRILSADRRYLWRPYTAHEDHQSRDPIVVQRAEGSWLYDIDGRRYLDGNASWWTCNLGHGHPRLREALAKQCETLIHCSLADTTHEQAAMLAETLCEAAPSGLERVFFSDDGSTAVEMAIKTAFQFFQQNGEAERKRFVCFGGAFHGETVGAMSVSGMPAFHGAFGPLLFDRFEVPQANDEEEWNRNIAALIEQLDAHGQDVAAVVLEPMVMGAGGMRFWSSKHFRAVAEATKRAGALLIADEVFVGLGRTGTLWACEHGDVLPDFLCSAKSLSGGMLPFAATLVTERVYEGFRGGKSRALLHGHTFCGNPLGAVIAREVLAIYRDERVLEGIPERSERMRQALSALAAALPSLRNPRVLGMVAAFEIAPQTRSGYFDNAGWRVAEAAKRRGAYIRPLGNTMYLVPSLNIPLGDLDMLLDILVASTREVLLASDPNAHASAP